MNSDKQRVLVTSGPTRAWFDSIRYIANTSSGALGACIVETLIQRNVPVLHIYGAGSETPAVADKHLHLYESIQVTTVDNLVEAIKSSAAAGRIGSVIHAMAVLDYVPESTLHDKKSSGEDYWDIRLVKTPKVIDLIRELIPDAFTVGFKLESGISDDQLILRAVNLLERCNLDMVVANCLENVCDTHHDAIFIGAGKRILASVSSKKAIAEKLAGYITERL